MKTIFNVRKTLGAEEQASLDDATQGKKSR